MANTTHKRSSKKSAVKTPAKRRTSAAAKTKESKAVRKTRNGKAAAKNAEDEERHLEKANAHLYRAWQNMYEIRIGKRKAKPPSLKWLKSLMTRTSL